MRGVHMGNWYEVLGTTSKADDEQIKSAFRNLAKTFHPDLNAGDETAEERFKEVKQAYEVLRDPGARATYDTYLAYKRSGARQRLRKAVATMSAAFVLSTATSFFLIIWLRGERFPLAQEQEHATERLSESVPDVPIPRPVNGDDSAAGRQGGDAGMATASSMGPIRVAEIGPTPESRLDSVDHIADTRLEAVGSSSPRSPTEAELGQALRLLNKGEQFLAQGNIVIAREYFARAAELGSPVAALRLAETYDPQESGFLAYGLRRDSSEARKWYERAVELGASEAEEKLRRLGNQ
jgi:curved DNA-binding protein CbpA